LIRQLDGVTGTINQHLAGHTADLTSIAISPNGDSVAVSDASGMVRLWEPGSGAVLVATQLLGPYHGMDITGATGLTLGQVQALTSLGAVSDVTLDA
jgi:WD40 repeat protein